MEDTPKQASIAYFNEVCANIRQLKIFQWQVVIVSVAMLAAIPTVGEIQSGSSLGSYLKIGKIGFCLIAVLYAVWHIHRYQKWLTWERQHRGNIQKNWIDSGMLHMEFESMHNEAVSYWFDWPALISWWLLILFSGSLSILNVCQ